MPKDEFFSDIGLEITIERSHALLIGDIQAATGITDYQLGVAPDPYEDAKALIREVCGE